MDKCIMKRLCVLAGAHPGEPFPPVSSRIPMPLGSHRFVAQVSVGAQSHRGEANYYNTRILPCKALIQENITVQ